MAHLKRYEMPRTWPVPVKSRFWVTRPSPGPHALKDCLPLQVILRDVLGLSATAAESRRILLAKQVLVDGVPRGPNFPVGLMDSLSIPELDKAYRMVPTKSGLRLSEIPISEAGHKLCQVRGVTTVRGGIFQLHLHDGRNILSKKPAEKPGDSLLISLPDQKPGKHVKREVGAHAVVVAGRSAGVTGTITEIRRRKSLGEQSIAVLDTPAGRTETSLDYVFPLTPELHKALAHKEHKK